MPPSSVTGEKTDVEFKYRTHPKPRHRTRVRFIVRALRDKMCKVLASDQVRGETAVDFGCGEKPYEDLFARKFKHYIGADLPGNPKAEIMLSPDGILPLADESADCVVSTQTLEHVFDPRQYLAEARRVLKPGASLILSTHGHWRYHSHPNDFWRWTVDGLKREIERAGFEIVQMHSILHLPTVALQLWQDATSGRLPGFLRSIYVRFFQLTIGLIERFYSDSGPAIDAAIYVVLARRK